MKYQTKQTLKTYWQHTWHYKLQVVLIFIGVSLHILLSNYSPILYGRLIDTLNLKDTVKNITPAISIVMLIAVISVTKLILARAFNYLSNYLQPRVMADLNNTCYKYLNHHSYEFFNNNFVGSLVTKVKRYEKSYEVIANQIIFDLGRTFLDTCIIIIILFNKNLTIGYIILTWIFVYLLSVYAFSKHKLKLDIKRASSDSLVTAQLADSIANNLNIKIFSNFNLEEKKFKQATEDQFNAKKASWDLGTTSEVMQSISIMLLEFCLLYLSVKYWQAGILTIGTIVLLQIYLGRLFDKLWSVGKQVRSIYEALADADEMTEVLSLPHELQDIKNAKALTIIKGEIEFQSVNFGYHKNADVLNNFSLTIKPGERIAIIGTSGGGKSTITKLLFRFFDLNDGKISIDGQNIAKVTQNSLREQLSLVPQEPILFHRSILENIKYAKPKATKKQIIAAAEQAHAHEFILTLPEGYDTLVGERGVKLSGGQRQRIAIARAILKNAPILILDEATSSLDSESEMFIQSSFKTLMQNRTTIVIAHRLSTIMQMDRIIVIDNGKILEQGKHEELLKAQTGLYQKLWEIQAGGFELNQKP